MGDFKKLRVWQQSHALTIQLYAATDAFPSSEKFGLSSQIRRAASSIAANIAESTGRFLPGDQRRFLTIAMGSARELEHHVILSQDLGYLDPAASDESLRSIGQIQRMLYRWLKNVAR